MTVDDVIAYFGSLYKVRDKTDFSMRTAYNWRERGFIPIKSQIRLEKITKGALKADLSHIG